MALRMKTLISLKRYEIYFADLNPSIGSEINKIRPVVVISGDEMNTNLEVSAKATPSFFPRTAVSQ